jgi:hypothetical protein
MGLTAGGLLKKYIVEHFPGALLAEFPRGMRLVVDLDAKWIPFVCTSESTQDLRSIAARFLPFLVSYAPSEVVLARESAGVPERKRVVQEKRDGPGLDERSRAEFERQWSGASPAPYSDIAAAAGAAMTPRQVSCALLTNRAVRRHLRDDFLAALEREHAGAAPGWPLTIHGDTLVRGDASTPFEGYNPGEGEFKFGHYLDGTPTIAVTSDTDALVVILCGLPANPPPRTHLLHLGDLILDMGALRARFETRGHMDAWLLGWLMCGTDYLRNPPKLGNVKLTRANERYGPALLRGAIRYRGPEALLDEERVLHYWFLLRHFAWLTDETQDASKVGRFRLGHEIDAHIRAHRGRDPESLMGDAMEIAMRMPRASAIYEAFASEHRALLGDLSWNVRYFWGAGRVPPKE